jgi:hypothetical protein
MKPLAATVMSLLLLPWALPHAKQPVDTRGDKGLQQRRRDTIIYSRHNPFICSHFAQSPSVKERSNYHE